VNESVESVRAEEPANQRAFLALVSRVMRPDPDSEGQGNPANPPNLWNPANPTNPEHPANPTNPEHPANPANPANPSSSRLILP
jgi:hypothetical protein